MSQATILVTDDELSVRQVITLLLEKNGFAVVQAADGAECMRMFYDHYPDLVILDILMPGLDGREVCRQLREISNVPILMLTALSDEKELVARLSDGADDYLVKPFKNDELVARIRTLLRRANPTAPERRYDDGFLSVDFDAHVIYLGGENVRPAPKEWHLLEYLIRHKNKPMPREKILRQVWGNGFEDANNILKVSISNLRQKLREPAKHPRYILTERSIGYRFQSREKK